MKPMKRHFVTIKDIARELNISVATVSRAMRDTYDVNQETRQLVLKKAQEMNYKPNFNATGLVKNSSHNIGVVLPTITNYYFSTVITGIQEVAYKKGYNIVLYITNDSAEREMDILNELSLGNMDGLLVCVSSDSGQNDHFEQIIADGIPIVFFDRVAHDIKASKIMQDDYHGAYQAVEHLIQQGYKKIAHIAGPGGLLFTERRMEGFLAAMKAHQLPVRKEWIIHSGFSRDFGEKDALQLLQSRTKPDAIFAVNDRKAIGAMLALKKKNIRIGKQIGVIGFTNDPMCEIISPSLTTVEEPALEIGRKSCEFLLNHINKKNFQVQELTLPTKLIVRESTMRD
jgi:LacI family transcriptional regulator